MFPPWTTPEAAAEILKNGGKIVAIPSRTRQPLAHRKAIRQVLK